MRTKIYLLTFLLLLLNNSIWGQVSQNPNLDGQQSKIFACSLVGETSIEISNRVIPNGTGNKSLDLSIQTDVLELQKVFGVVAKMYLFQEVGSPNAFAVDKPLFQLMEQFRLPLNTSVDGMVFLGVNLVQSEYRSEFGTGYSIPSIIAHEYAHILQSKLNSPLNGKWRELQADYLAGWYTAHRSRYVSQNINEAMLSFFRKGDYDFNAPYHHGLPQERQQAFLAGLGLNFQSNIKSGRIAYSKSMLFFQQQNAD